MLAGALIEDGRRRTIDLPTAPSGCLNTAAYQHLAETDPVLDAIVRTHGRPDPFVWAGSAPAGYDSFAALTLHIISQQISTAAALKVFARLQAAAGGEVSARSVLVLDRDRLRGVGMSRAKAEYVWGIAQMEQSGTLGLGTLGGLDDAEVVAALTRAPGIGRWTAEMFLIHPLRRVDVLPAGDLGIRQAVAQNWHLPSLPTATEVASVGHRWSPYRTYASALLWNSLGAPVKRGPARGADLTLAVEAGVPRSHDADQEERK